MCLMFLLVGITLDTRRVFTCGDGTFGQLGHGDFQSQCLPIEVMYFRTEKDITPIGGLPYYGVVKEDYLLIKGCCVKPKKRVVTLRQSLLKQTSRLALEVVAS
ncbi:hypothetical protein IFM89_009421 [Coptis chinensis]|uniref:Uncharacterized protein n=1 Tax=Coptis chinensis TaxID=261450 RepID=A0A835GVP3_9MAGN|nr:hypothetical protein IFM89_009421 [Coptis chinensis]